jgi:anaerobic magnesium-protoporphyrin IX monomethyl ester cyclase
MVKLCKQVGIKTGLNFIIGLPFETRSTILSSIWLALKMRKYAESANCAILVPFPGTKVYEMAMRNKGCLGIKTTDWSDFGKQAGFALRHDNFKSGELQRWQSLFYVLYYLGAPSQMLRFFSLAYNFFSCPSTSWKNYESKI